MLIPRALFSLRFLCEGELAGTCSTHVLFTLHSCKLPEMAATKTNLYPNVYKDKQEHGQGDNGAQVDLLVSVLFLIILENYRFVK